MKASSKSLKEEKIRNQKKICKKTKVNIVVNEVFKDNKDKQQQQE